MNIRIRATRAGEISLSPVRNPEPQILQDKKTFRAQGEFGEIQIRSYEANGISMLHHSLQFKENDELTYSNPQPSIRLQIVLRNSYYFESRYFGKTVVHERGMLLQTTPDIHTTIRIRANETYSHLSLLYQPEHIRVFQPSFPRLEKLLVRYRAGQASLYNKAYCIAGYKILSLVDYLLDNYYTGQLQMTWFQTLAKDILLEALLYIDETDPGHTVHIREKEVQRIYQAKEYLHEHLHLPFSLSRLAEILDVSAFRLTREFKAVYGMGLKEYVLEARMKKAIRILAETDTPIAAVARDSGYASAQSFSLAFKNYFGCTPGSVHRRGKSFGGRIDRSDEEG